MPRLMSYRSNKIRFSNPLAPELSQISYAVVRTEIHLKLVSLNHSPHSNFSFLHPHLKVHIHRYTNIYRYIHTHLNIYIYVYKCVYKRIWQHSSFRSHSISGKPNKMWSTRIMKLLFVLSDPNRLNYFLFLVLRRSVTKEKHLMFLQKEKGK